MKLTEAQEILEKHKARLAKIHEVLKDEPEYVRSMFNIAMNMHQLATEIENNRIEQLHTLQGICSQSASATKKITDILTYVDQKLETQPNHDGP